MKIKMRIIWRLLLAFLFVSVLPLLLLALSDLRSMETMRTVSIAGSSAALRAQGEASIHHKAQDIARQVDLYLAAHPDLLAQPPAAWAADAALVEIAVQPVGKSGYTALYDSSGVVYAHANPKLVGQNMRIMANNFPAFYAVFSASLDGSAVNDYYDWPEADGTIRQKYMSCAPVGDTHLRIAATTYIDEFLQPIHQTESLINAIFSLAYRYQLLGLLGLALLAVWLAFWQARALSRPIAAITAAAAEIEAGRFDESPPSPLAALEGLSRRGDELGQLAHVFRNMAAEVRAREQRLKEEVHLLRIEIDESRKQRQVEEITETEYFRQLQQRVAILRQRRSAN